MAFLAKLIPLCLLSFLLASLAVGATPGATAPDAGAPDGGSTQVKAAGQDGGRTATANADGGAPAARPVADPWPAARNLMRALTSSVEHIQRMRAKSPPDAYSLNCVTERLAEARIGVQLGDREMERLQTHQHDAAEQAYALHRLQLLAERASTVVGAARICIRDDPGGITATKVEVEVPRGLPAGDPTAAPLPPPPETRPANDK
jgi:hypothetical protein